MVFKLGPPYLCDLFPDFVFHRSCYSICSANNFFLPNVRTDRHKISLLFSSIKWWNSLTLEIRMSSSLGIFKHNLLKYLQFPSRNYLFYIGNRPASISHTRVRLNLSALKCHLSKKIVLNQPVLFATHLLKNLNIIFCTAQVFLLGVKSCLPPLHIYLEIDGIVLPIGKKLIGF